jgi:hypothetical protein
MAALVLIKRFVLQGLFVFFLVTGGKLSAQTSPGTATGVKGKDEKFSLEWPPLLPGGKTLASDVSPLFIRKPDGVKLADSVLIAKSAPRIDFFYLPAQTYPGKLWSVWGDGTAVGTKYYTSIGDHNSPRGEAQVYEYDLKTKKVRLLMSVRKFLEKPGVMPGDMDYTPGKIHGRLDRGDDGRIYFSTHRGSTNDNTTDKRGYRGDHIYSINPVDGKAGIVAAFPVEKHTIPASVLDPQRMIFYGGTNPGNDATDKNINFIAYDVKNRKLLKKAPDGFDRYAIWSSRTGCVYWKGAKKDRAKYNYDGGYKYDPTTNKITRLPQVPNVRAATHESSKGLVYGFTQDDNNIWAFNTKTETLANIGPAMVGVHSYVTSVDLDPATERYLYYIPGAHGGAEVDGTPVIQYDLKTKTRKVIAFMSGFYKKTYQYSPDGTFSSALNADGSVLFVTWNGARESPAKGWNTVAVTAIHIPASERQP